MALKRPNPKKRKNTVTKSGASSSSGHQKLSFKKGTPNHTETKVNKTRPNKISPLNFNDRKRVAPHERRVGETITEYKARRKADRL